MIYIDDVDDEGVVCWCDCSVLFVLYQTWPRSGTQALRIVCESEKTRKARRTDTQTAVARLRACSRADCPFHSSLSIVGTLIYLCACPGMQQAVVVLPRPNNNSGSSFSRSDSLVELPLTSPSPTSSASSMAKKLCPRPPQNNKSPPERPPPRRSKSWHPPHSPPLRSRTPGMKKPWAVRRRAAQRGRR